MARHQAVRTLKHENQQLPSPCYDDKGSEKTSHQRRWALLQYPLLRYEGLFMRCRDDSVPVNKIFLGLAG
jgi:hypothetical protein